MKRRRETRITMADETTPGTGTSNQEPGSLGTSGVGEGEEVSRLRSENTRLRQSLADSEKLGTRAVPLVRIAQALINAPGGNEIVEKLEKGEPLTKAEERKVEKAAETPVTLAAVEELLDKKMQETSSRFGQTVAAERKAAESLKALDERAVKELEGYKDLKRDPQFNGWVSAVIEQLRQEQEAPGTGIVLPPEEDDVWWFAVKTAHRISHALAGKPKKGKGEAERVAEALTAGGAKSSSTGAGGSDIPEDMREEIERIRGYSNPLIAGKSFGNPQK